MSAAHPRASRVAPGRRELQARGQRDDRQRRSYERDGNGATTLHTTSRLDALAPAEAGVPWGAGTGIGRGAQAISTRQVSSRRVGGEDHAGRECRRPFRRGDQIATNGCEGTVIDVNFRTVVLRSFDGERLLVPCSQVLANPITNYTALGQRRTTLSVSVSYDADLERARHVLSEAVTGVVGVLDRPSAEVWVEEFADSGITVAIRFWHAPDIATLWRVRSDVAVAAKRALERSGIEIPFPQRVLRFADAASAQRPGDDAGQRSAGAGAPPEAVRRPSPG